MTFTRDSIAGWETFTIVDAGDGLVALLGSNNKSLNIAKTGLTKILFCGLQGSGKTTTVAKLANYIKKDTKKKILLVSADIYRPAAQDQLQVLSKQINIEFFDHKNFQSVETITLESIKYAEKNLFDIILFDTAGRQVVDNKMMEELKNISQKLNPQDKHLRTHELQPFVLGIIVFLPSLFYFGIELISLRKSVAHSKGWAITLPTLLFYRNL